MERKNINSVLGTTVAKTISAAGVIFLQLVIARLNGETAVGMFSSMLSILFFIGIISRWGGAELIFKDARVIENRTGTVSRQTFVFGIMLRTLTRSIISVFVFAIINFFVLPIVGLNTILPNVYFYCLIFSAPFFALASINANYFYFLNKNIIAGFSEPGGIAFITTILISIGLWFGLVGSGSFTHLAIYVILAIGFGAFPVIRLAYILHAININYESYPKKNNQFLQTSLFVYFGQWGVIMVLSTNQSPSIIGIISVCLQVSISIDFIMRIASALYNHKIRFAYQSMPLERFTNQIENVSRIVAIGSIIAFVFILFCAESIFNVFGFTDKRFYFIFYALITARLVNSLFGMNDAFLIMTNLQKHYKWNIILTGSIAFVGACLSETYSIEVVVSIIASSVILRNIISSIIIFNKSSIIMVPFFVRTVRKKN